MVNRRSVCDLSQLNLIQTRRSTAQTSRLSALLHKGHAALDVGPGWKSSNVGVEWIIHARRSPTLTCRLNPV